MEEKIEYILKWMKGDKAPPFTIELNITNKCNLKCRMCWLRSFSYEKPEVKEITWKKVVKEACDLGVEEFRIPGSGEPFMKKKLVLELVKIIKEKDKKGLLISNGTLIDKKVAEVLVKFEWDILTISIDGPNEEIHDYIRGIRGAFRRTILNVKRIVSLKRKYGKEYPYLRMNTVITNKNVNFLREIVLLGHKLGFSEVLFQPITIFSEEGRRLLPSEDSVRVNLLKAAKVADKIHMRTNATKLLEEDSIQSDDLPNLWNRIFKENKGFLRIPCYEPFYNIVITSSGSVGPCAVFGGSSSFDIRSMNLRTIWYKGFKLYRDSLKKGKMFKFCKNCCIPIFMENQRIRNYLRGVYG